MGRAEAMTDDQMKSLEVITGLNSGSETSQFMKDKENSNKGYPILTWQGTPNASDSTVSVSFTGEAQDEMELTAEIATELNDYSVEWLLLDDSGFSVITEKKEIDGEEVDVPYTGLTLSVPSEYVGKYLKVRVTDNEDGSSMASSAQGPVKPSPIKKIYFEGNPNPDEDMPVTLIYNNVDQTSEHGSLSVNVLTDPLQSNSLLDGEAISWNSSDETVASVAPVSENAVYSHEEETPAAAVIEAKGEGSADITVTIGEFEAVAKVSVYPAYVTAQARIGDSQAFQEVTVKDEDLSAVYGDALAGSPRYVTPLHLLTTYVRDVLEKDPAAVITITDQKVTAVDGEEGNWLYVADGKFGGSVDTSAEIKGDAEVTFIRLDENSPVDKAASFGQSVYEGICTVDMEVTLQAASLSGNTLAPLKGASVTAKKDGVSVNGLEAVTDEEGKAVLCFSEAGEYQLSAVHTNEAGENDIIAPYAKAVVAEKVPVTDIEWVSTDIPQTMEAGTTYQLTAQVKPENANYKGVIYTSDKEDVISVNASGLLTANTAGTAKITAASEENPEIRKEVSISVIRSVKEIRLQETKAVIRTGGTYQIQASVLPEDATNQELEFISNKMSIASVDEKGLITGRSAGETTITIVAKDKSGIRAEFTVTVGEPVTAVRLKETSAEIKIGETYQIEASVEPENASVKELTYASDKPDIADVDAKGVITGKAAGTAQITVTAADGSGVSSKFTVTVKEPVVVQQPVTAIRLKETSAEIKIGETYQIEASVEPENATVKELTYASDKTDIAEVDTKGVITGKAAGTAQITVAAADGSGVSAQLQITVEGGAGSDPGSETVHASKVTLNKTKISLQIGRTYTLKASVAPKNAVEKKVTWSTSNPKTATVTASGKVKAKKAGTVKITAKTANGKKAVCTVTVKKPAIKLNKKTLKLKKGKTNKTIKIKSSTPKGEKIKSAKSSKPKVAKVSVKKGKLTIKGRKKGSAVITITSTNGGTAKVKVTVKK